METKERKQVVEMGYSQIRVNEEQYPRCSRPAVGDINGCGQEQLVLRKLQENTVGGGSNGNFCGTCPPKYWRRGLEVFETREGKHSSVVAGQEQNFTPALLATVDYTTRFL